MPRTMNKVIRARKTSAAASGASETCCSNNGIRVKYAAQVNTRKNKLCRTINFGRTLRSSKILAKLELVLSDKNYCSGCARDMAVIEEKEVWVTTNYREGHGCNL